MEPKSSLKRFKSRQETHPKTDVEKVLKNDTRCLPEWSKNGAKVAPSRLQWARMGPKWHQNGTKMAIPARNSINGTLVRDFSFRLGHQNGIKMAPKWHHISRLSIIRISKMKISPGPFPLNNGQKGVYCRDRFGYCRIARFSRSLL